MIKIGIVDYGMGNLRSVFNAFDYIGADVEICKNPLLLKQYDKIVLPGVGAFGDCIANLHKTGFAGELNECVLTARKPVLGICLGMQVMAAKGYENGEQDGLGWFDAEVVRISPFVPELKVPQIGWNEIEYDRNCFLFNDLPENPEFYFVHSYHMACTNAKDLAAYCDYGQKVTAAVIKENIFATQFHPEKSQEYGLKILENFLEWKP